MKFILTFLLIWVTSDILTAQKGPQLVNVTHPSPNLQAMQKYGDIPLSPYTGVPNISIPLYNIQFRDITVPISISYHASGIKVAEEASQVGLGWVLNANGSISRNVAGQDDWLGSTYFNDSWNSLPDFSNGVSIPRNVQQTCTLQYSDALNNPQRFDLTPYVKGNGNNDFQPDQYYYNLPGGHSGKFVLKRTKEAVLQSEEQISIVPGAEGKSWEVKDADGFTYEFTEYETYKNFDENLQDHMSAWYLTKIISPTGANITYYYSHPSGYINPVESYSESRQDFIYPLGPVAWGVSVYSFPSTSGWSNNHDYTITLLDSISFTSGVVVFNYSDDRADLGGERKLTNLSVFSKDANGSNSAEPVKTYSFRYDYFDGGADNSLTRGYDVKDRYSQRLKLVQLQESGNFNGSAQTKPPYTFHYFDDNANLLPAKTSFAKDHWGYYNGKMGRTTLSPSFMRTGSSNSIIWAIGNQGNERDADPNYMKAFSLQSISYPTGGSTEFEYEANTFDEQKSQVNDHSYFNTITPYSIVPQDASLVYDYASGKVWQGGQNTFDITNEFIDPQAGSAQPVTATISWRFSETDCDGRQIMNAPNKLTFTIYSETDNQFSPETRDIHLIDNCTNGNTNDCKICQSGVYSYKTTFALPPGRYRVEVYADDASYSNQLQSIQFGFVWVTEVNSDNSSGTGVTFSYGGGLRIKQITDHDGVSAGNDKVTQYIYHYQEDKNGDGVAEEYSYGRRMSKPEYSYFIPTVETNDHYDGETYIFHAEQNAVHLMRSSDSNEPLNGSASGCVVGYDVVTVLYGANGANGKTVYTYHNNPDYVYPYTDVSTDQSAPLQPPPNSTLPDLLNGSLLQKTDYKNTDQDFRIVSSVTNEYTTDSRIANDVWGIQTTQTIYDKHITGVNEPAEPSSGPSGNDCAIYNLSYQMPLVWNYLSRSVARTYDRNDESKFTETETDYRYDNPKHCQLTRTVTTDSKGQTVTTHTSYPLDFEPDGGEGGSGIRYLQDNHVITAPVETYVIKTGADGNNIGTVTAVLNEYKDDLPKPAASYVLESAKPVAEFTPLARNADYSSRNPQYAERIVYDDYDRNGNLLQQHKASDVNHSYIWDYNNSLPIAEAVNAPQTNIKYTSFEADGTGGWTFDKENIKHEKSVTGSADYLLDEAHPIHGNTTTAGDYITSCWIKDGSGQASVDRLPGTAVVSKNGWTLYVFTLSREAEISVQGNAIIDELRLYPSGSRMTTYTYEPLTGITSLCDANNKISYYEYEGLGRLKLIRDADNSIIKKFDYGYQTANDPDWENTGTGGCEKNGDGKNTGYLTQQQQDKNPNSFTYGNYRWHTTATYDPSTCPLHVNTCAFVMQTDENTGTAFTSVTNDIDGSDGTQVTFHITFRASKDMYTTKTYHVAYITGGCLPSTNQTYSISSGGGNWTVTITTEGHMYWHLDSIQEVNGQTPSQITAGIIIASGALLY